MMSHRSILSVILFAVGLVSPVSGQESGLRVYELGTLRPGLSRNSDESGSADKWARVRTLLGDDSSRVLIKQIGGSLGGNTSVRNSWPLVWKERGYFRRARDLGQVFRAPRDFTLDAIVLRTGNAHLAFLPGAAGAEVFVQFFTVSGEPKINDNGTPPGSAATHGFSTNHRCDDFVSGVTYHTMRIVQGGMLPDLTKSGDGKLTYLKWQLDCSEPIRFRKGKRYAFMVGFVDAGPERNFTLSNRNLAADPGRPTMTSDRDNYHEGWGLRREGSGQNPPLAVPGPQPPTDADLLQRLRTQSKFPEGSKRYAIAPTCEGYPDVDTYRDLEFYIIAK